MKFKLIPNWKEAHKMASVQIAALMGILSTAYDYLPVVQQYFPSMWVQGISVAIIIARIVYQANVKKE